MMKPLMETKDHSLYHSKFGSNVVRTVPSGSRSSFVLVRTVCLYMNYNNNNKAHLFKRYGDVCRMCIVEDRNHFHYVS